MGAITTARQINDANWKRVDKKNLRKGLLADGLTALISGALGTMGQGCTPTSVGLSKASGVTSRYVAYGFAIICLILALCPKLGAVLCSLPVCVVAGGLLFISCILFVGGIKIITITEIDARKTFIVCVSLFAGLSTVIFPDFYAHFPPVVYPLVSSPLSLGTLLALIMNLIFRLGICRYERIIISTDSHTFYDELKAKINKLGVAANVEESILQSFTRVVKLIIDGRYNHSDIHGELSYDELNFVISLHYTGALVALPQVRKEYQPEDLDDENAFVEGISAIFRNFSTDKVDLSHQHNVSKIKLYFAI